MKLYRIFVVFLLACGIGMASAATDEQMDKARAIAAKYYLRYANNMSDYLDNINPSSMADLKGKLKEKDLENLKAFENTAYSKDYASWDKGQLSEYWGSTFFKEHSGSLDKAGQNLAAQRDIKSNIGNMTVTVVQPQAPEPAPAPQQEPVATPPSDPMTTQQPMIPSQDILAAQEAAALAELEAAQNEEEATEEETPPEEKQEEQSSGTWVYVMILCILVAVVIALVVYASKTMKAQKLEDTPEDKDIDRYEPMSSNAAALAESHRLRERYAESLAAKNEELRSLGRRAEELERENYELKSELRHLKQELSILQGPSQRGNMGAAPVGAAMREPAFEQPMREPFNTDLPQQRPQRHIYLGRVNNRGLFVRADKNINPGHSVYRLSTDNGVTGTFTVVDEPATVVQALNAPEIWLAGGCVAKDIADTYNRSFIVTEAPGTAVFEDGAWKVLRKARIRFD